MPVSAVFTTTDNYTDANTIGRLPTLSMVQFTVANASVAAQPAKKGKDGDLYFDESEAFFAPGVNGFSGKIFGVRFRSLVAGSPAVVLVNCYFVDDPIPFASPTPFDGTLGTGGGFVPPPSGSGIQFDVENLGDWLHVETNEAGSSPGDGNAIHLNNSSNDTFLIEQSGTFGKLHLLCSGLNGIVIEQVANQTLQILATGASFPGAPLIIQGGDGISILIDNSIAPTGSSSPLFIDTLQAQLISIGATESDSGNVVIGNDPTFVGNSVGFFLQENNQETLPANPTTAQIRQVLVDYGLVAP